MLRGTARVPVYRAQSGRILSDDLARYAADPLRMDDLCLSPPAPARLGEYTEEVLTHAVAWAGRAGDAPRTGLPHVSTGRLNG